MYHRLALLSAFAALAFPAVAQTSKPAAQVSRPIARAVFIANMDGEFRKMDADKNGSLTRTEIEQYQRLTAVVQAQARTRALFARLDADRSGQLSLAEFAKLIAKPPAPNASPVLARFDSNRDKAVSLVEYRTVTVANFDRLDTDKDGYVSPAEMKAGTARK